jgi:hypothetical protein
MQTYKVEESQLKLSFRDKEQIDIGEIYQKCLVINDRAYTLFVKIYGENH